MKIFKFFIWNTYKTEKEISSGGSWTQHLLFARRVP